MTERIGIRTFRSKYVDQLRTFVVHPDLQAAYRNYRDGDSFEKMFEKRREKTANGEAYWNTDHDEEMLETARERSQNPEWIAYCREHNIRF